MLVVIQMSDVEYLHPNDATDPNFGAALREAAANGVQVMAVAFAFFCSPKAVPVATLFSLLTVVGFSGVFIHTCSPPWGVRAFSLTWPLLLHLGRARCKKGPLKPSGVHGHQDWEQAGWPHPDAPAFRRRAHDSR